MFLIMHIVFEDFTYYTGGSSETGQQIGDLP